MKNKFFTLLLILIGMSSLTVNAQKEVTLRLQPQQGQTFTCTSKVNATTMIKVQGQSMNMSQLMEIRQSYNAKEVTNEQSVIETQIEAIKMTMSQMGMKLEYDSDHPEKTSPMLAGQTKELEANLKKPTTITYDALGKIVGDKADLELNQLANVILELPKDKIEVGSKWSSKKTQTVSDSDFEVNMEYTVTAISKKSVDISFTGNADSSDITGTYNGTASINPQTGMITSSTTKSTVSMTVSEQGMSMPITVTSTSTVEVK